MMTFYLSLISVLLYYSKSKYFPDSYRSYMQTIPSWLGFIGFGLVILFFCLQWGGVNGLLLSLLALPLACCLVPLVSHIPARVALPLILLFHLFLLLTLLGYAR